MVALAGLLKFGGDLLGWDAPVDQFLFAGKLAVGEGAAANHMVPNSALNFLLIGLALLFLDAPTRKGRYPAQFLGLAVGLSLVLALTGYIFGVSVFYRFGSMKPMSLNAASGFFVLSLGVLGARPGRGVTRVVFSKTTGGTMMRRLLPTAMLVPLALGLIWRWAERAGYLGTGFGLPLTVVSSVALFVVVLYFSANWLDPGG